LKVLYAGVRGRVGRSACLGSVIVCRGRRGIAEVINYVQKYKIGNAARKIGIQR